MQLRITHYRLNEGDDPRPFSNGSTTTREIVEGGGGNKLLIGGQMTGVYSILFEGGYEWRGYHWIDGNAPPAAPRATPAPAPEPVPAPSTPPGFSPAPAAKPAMTFEAALRASGRRYSFLTIGLVRAGWDLAQWAEQGRK